MNTGGPAFPVPDSHHANGQVQYGANGMTLLDWFAGQALQGRAHRFDNPYERRNLLAQDCYDIAESMLAEKARRESDHSGDANKMVELEARNRELVEALSVMEMWVPTHCENQAVSAARAVLKKAKEGPSHEQ